MNESDLKSENTDEGSLAFRICGKMRKSLHSRLMHR